MYEEGESSLSEVEQKGGKRAKHWAHHTIEWKQGMSGLDVIT
jgi:hypothetical protein